jgi:phosphoribosylformimino-5-aminoimidazole carboxamide ribonucleotide (ProFAR) isomerase
VTPSSWRRLWSVTATASSSPSTPATARSRSLDLGSRGVARFLCTAIEVDGTMKGPALGELARIASGTEAQVIASGGVGDLSHLEDLAELATEHPNLEGAIVGRALYEQKFTVREALDTLAGAS